MFIRCLFILALVGTFLTACRSDSPSEPESSNGNSSTTKTVTVPRFERDSAYRYVHEQVAFGPRVPNSESHSQAKEYLSRQLERFGAEVSQQDFSVRAYTGTTLNGTNIIGRYRPELKRRIMLAAHWDSRHTADSPLNTGSPDQAVAGADDGASGVGVLLEIARLLGQDAPDIGIDIVFFDAEDHGTSSDPNSWGLGAQHFARNYPIPKPEYGILLDMVGSKGARFPMEGYSRQYAPQLVAKVWRLAAQLGYGNYFVAEDGAGITDDHYFINTIARVPMIDIINRSTSTETGFGAHWHTDHDDMSIIDARSLRAVGQTILELIYREAAGTI